MSNEVFVVAYEGGGGGSNVLDYAIARAKKEGAELRLVHVLEWSPYQFLTPEELEERHARRNDEVRRAQAHIIDPAIEKARTAGVTATGDLSYGSVVPLVAKAAKSCGASMIFVGRSGSDSIGARIFGSVPLGLAQIASVPTVIVP
ncbi:Nucleotide-binding universal stress protein, UspA family [Tranquillimonas rosea]|uniref:Nucleotide-binding universal stress protein, UspA family n=1 Tax=Tranquillimonas rosea TaxID=641238 RepID=A0A1H9PUX0_9RHOB|nr:universal stress protein [Tranquillimonas rosea]SER52011.1 Nucleotide-binding universal stress protein, UspA family [Tranquillimonas rosea]